ncbi:MAG: flagellar motor protein MotB, partial [Candidatus Hydrogenedentota bacterium]
MFTARKPEAVVNVPIWAVTFADLMTLILAFFVLLLSFTTFTKPEEFDVAMESFRGAAGIIPGEPTEARTVPRELPTARPAKTVEDLARRVRGQLQVLGMDDNVKVEFEGEGTVKLSLPNQFLFDTASADLRADVYPVLNNVAAVLADYPTAEVEVSGHTDNQPLRASGIYRDNYDLSYHRAESVGRYLMAERIENIRMIAAGDREPIGTNETEEGRQANRRVEIRVTGL